MSGEAGRLRLRVLEGRYAVARLEAEALAPKPMPGDDLFSLTWTGGELSVVCRQDRLAAPDECELDFRVLEVAGPLDFGLTGVLARLTASLAAAKIPVFALSTFATDYLLVREAHLEQAVSALEAGDFEVARVTGEQP